MWAAAAKRVSRSFNPIDSWIFEKKNEMENDGKQAVRHLSLSENGVSQRVFRIFLLDPVGSSSLSLWSDHNLGFDFHFQLRSKLYPSMNDVQFVKEGHSTTHS